MEISESRLTRCNRWVDQQNHLRQTEEHEGQDLRERPHDSGSSDDDSNIPLEQYLSLKEMQRQARGKKITEQIIHMNCEWLDCTYKTDNYVQFKSHIKSHIPNVYIKTYDSGEKLYACQWEECGFETQSDAEVVRHINYHGYHSRLKAIGVNVHERYSMDKCSRASAQRNQIPELLSNHSCQWTGCTLSFNSIQDYFDHVSCHVLGVDPEQDGWLSCKWLGCRQRFRSLNKVKEHARRHTAERVVACSHCGGMFASNAVYEDHCVRQALAAEEYRCETCGKLFSSERLMRNHARRHINSFKCSFCDMTASAPSALTKHIRYRHLNYRPFKCRYCTYTAVGNIDMRNHLLRHEGLTPKQKKATSRIYVCHYCEDFFNTGHTLTKHLVRIHGYNQASGFTRFRYEESEDGFYRLMPLRYESLEVSKQIMAEQNEKKTFDDKILEEKDIDDFKVVQCFKGDNEKPASFLVLPSSIQDKESLKAILTAQKENDVLDKKSDYNDNARAIKKPNKVKKTNKKSIGKNLRNKRTRTEINNSSSSQTDVFNSSSQVNINEFSCMKRFRNFSPSKQEPKNIEISIAHIDKDGNIIKSEVIESQEMIV
ncbi:histone H4 transcription factor [Arctopsyche grandis]|uniref:histone H4 transcription factor n=1 Tax=Arctopsyche grandis TaxID=121162 RepID=UPI00406D6CE8